MVRRHLGRAPGRLGPHSPGPWLSPHRGLFRTLCKSGGDVGRSGASGSALDNPQLPSTSPACRWRSSGICPLRCQRPGSPPALVSQRGQGGPSHPSSLCTQVHLHRGPPGPPDWTGPARSQLSMPFPQEPRELGVLVGGAKPQLGGGALGPWAAVTMLRGGCRVHAWPLTSSLWAASPPALIPFRGK